MGNSLRALAGGLLLAWLLLAGTASARAEVLYSDNQILVNQTNRLPAAWQPQDLTATGRIAPGNAGTQLRAEAAAALQTMLTELQQAGITDIYLSSGYRSYATQRNVFANRVARARNEGNNQSEAEREAASWVMPEGQSEHQTGLVMDVSAYSVGLSLNGDFADTPAGAWLAEHCWEFGFIIRYTEEKQHITGVSPEPWHLRYVGLDHAFYMTEHGLCLEEYHALLAEQGFLLFENAAGEPRAVYYTHGDVSQMLPGEVLSVSRATAFNFHYIITTAPAPLPEPAAAGAEFRRAQLCFDCTDWQSVYQFFYALLPGRAPSVSFAPVATSFDEPRLARPWLESAFEQIAANR